MDQESSETSDTASSPSIWVWLFFLVVTVIVLAVAAWFLPPHRR